MPHLRFRAIESEKVRDLSDILVEKLSFALSCPEDYFTFECIHSDFYFKEVKVKAIPQIEIHWFERGQDLRNLVAQIVHEEVLRLGFEETIIWFTPLIKEAYYDNGQHY